MPTKEAQPVVYALSQNETSTPAFPFPNPNKLEKCKHAVVCLVFPWTFAIAETAQKAASTHLGRTTASAAGA